MTNFTEIIEKHTHKTIKSIRIGLFSEDSDDNDGAGKIPLKRKAIDIETMNSTVFDGAAAEVVNPSKLTCLE